MVKKVTFVGFRGAIAPSGSAPTCIAILQKKDEALM